MTSSSICIPSNRKLSECLEPIWSALDYARERGMQVVVSDNSGDPEKRDYFANAPDHMLYIPNGPSDAGQNALNALRNAQSEFALLLGDDDYLTAVNGAHAFDFTALEADVGGVKPRIEIWSESRGVSFVDDFELASPDAATRVIAYSKNVRKANSSYYSFFRRSTFLDIYNLFSAHHPLPAGYSDWAIVYALVASGRLLHDPSTKLRYNNSRWDDLESASRALEDLHGASGLPMSVRPYMLLLHFLDTHVLIFRASSNLEPIDKFKAGYAASMVFLKRFLFRVGEMPELYQDNRDLITPLAAAVEASDPDLDQMFHIGGLIAERLKPGLKSGYDNYLLAAVRG